MMREYFVDIHSVGSFVYHTDESIVDFNELIMTHFDNLVGTFRVQIRITTRDVVDNHITNLQLITMRIHLP